MVQFGIDTYEKEINYYYLYTLTCKSQLDRSLIGDLIWEIITNVKSLFFAK